MFNRALCFICFLLASCSGLRYLPEGEKLYTGADIELKSDKPIKNSKSLKQEVEDVILIKPNRTFLGMRPSLCVYGIMGNPKKKGLRKFLKDKLGEPPVLYSKVDTSLTAKAINALLYNRGIFNAQTQASLKESKKTVRVKYTSYGHQPYKIKQVVFLQQDTLMNLIASQSNKSLLIPGDYYNLEIIKEERNRIDAFLGNSGYYYFSPNYLFFKADTSEADHTVTLGLLIKEDTPRESLTPYYINTVTVDMDYSLEEESKGVTKDTMTLEGVLFKYKELIIRPNVLLRSVFLRPGEIYSNENNKRTLNQLITMENFKFVNIKLTKGDSIGSNKLNVYIQLTRTLKRTMNYELSLVSKSNDFFGPELNLNYKNKNTINGAEQLNLSIVTSFETQLSGKYEGLFSYEITPKAELFVPRFIVPFKLNSSVSNNVPRTKFSLSYSYLHRINYYDLTSLQGEFGYVWKGNAKTSYEFYPLNLNFTSLSNESEDFLKLLQDNPDLRESYEEQFIAGMMYSFTYNERVVERKKKQFYFNVTGELSGNALSVGKKVFYNEEPSPENPQTVAGFVYSQFARATFDTRYTVNFRRKNKIVMRNYVGLGLPYGNSDVLPYIRQFFSGGPNSVRAFNINSLGPGTYQQSTDQSSAFVEQGGDIKIEGNIEYRNNLIGYFKGAVFVDAGNMWLFNENPAVPSEVFSFSRFYKEIAVGTGVGLRFDATFFAVRFDLAFPLRIPWREEGNRWVVDEIDFSSSGWRNENLLLNIAIGYPF